MPDISMCTNKGCTLKEKCYRFNAIPHHLWQSYAGFVQNNDGTCNNFIEIKKNDKKVS